MDTNSNVRSGVSWKAGIFWGIPLAAILAFFGGLLLDMSSDMASIRSELKVLKEKEATHEREVWDALTKQKDILDGIRVQTEVTKEMVHRHWMENAMFLTGSKKHGHENRPRMANAPPEPPDKLENLMEKIDKLEQKTDPKNYRNMFGQQRK